MAFATESSRFYDPVALEAVGEVKSANGSLRPATIRDAKKHGWFPSVTTAMKIVAAPGLEHWRRQQILMAALTLPRIEGEGLDDFSKRIETDSEAQGKAARERGTAIHGAIEQWFRGEHVKVQAEFLPYCMAVETALAEAGYRGPWEAERAFVNTEHGFGGKTDLFSRVPRVLCDYKTKDPWELKPNGDPVKTMWGDDQPIQLAANAIGQGIPDALLVSVFISRTEPVQVYIKKWDDNAYWFNRFLKRLECYKSEKDWVTGMNRASV